MKIALLFPPWMLAFRKSIDFARLRSDSRGLTGSELGFVRIGEELAKLGHEVHLYTISNDENWAGCHVHGWAQDPPTILDDGTEIPNYLTNPLSDNQSVTDCDVVISVNSPDHLRGCAGLRVCCYWINEVSALKVGFDEHVDLWQSPSASHLDQMLNNPRWRMVEVTPDYPTGRTQYTPEPAKWVVIPLGCDPERYDRDVPKVPGRVLYCSSPDRGLHWVLQEWPRIKRAVPHAHLRITYRLQPWIDGFKTVAYFPPIERLRARALYIEEALRRMRGPEWGIKVLDSVSRERIEEEMMQAEVLAYPVETTSWSEGFSVSTLEGCAGRACPVIFDCDALGEIYKDVAIIARRGDTRTWGDYVIQALRDPELRELINKRARAFAETHTWKRTAESILFHVEQRIKVAA
jgi:glycosyltransferase involved in cell wall biosynthesis